MKNSTISFLSFCLFLLFFAFLPSKYVQGQCNGPTEQVLHTSGTAYVGCTEVTVAPFGSAGNFSGPPCFVGPHGCGLTGSGGFTFTFSPPVAGVEIDVFTLDNNNGDVEEMLVDVNGSFYPITNPGVPDACHPEAIIWPSGSVRGPVDDTGAWKEIPITGTINTLKVENNWVSGFPAGIAVRIFLCCLACETNAGEIIASALNLCPNDPATFPPAEQTFLDSDDLLQYILFSDLNDILGSIIQTSNSPVFYFDPTTMSTGVTYYIAAIAGNDLNGNVDLDDPCLDISNNIEVIWQPEPTVTFVSNITNICPDNCYDVGINFTGSPPFQLTGEVTTGPNIISTFTETYQDMTGTLNICLPSNTPIGTVTIQATTLTDANCTCN